ncbi:9209_t:CDS:2, partial [Dentiscutata heterogama]
LLFKMLDTNIQNINVPDINFPDINIQDISIQDTNIQDINVQDIFNEISQDCKYCTTKYASSTSTETLKEHVKKNHFDIYKQKTKSEIIPYNQEEQLEYNKYLINWIIKSLQPFLVTEKESF